MTPDELCDICLALPQAIETFPFGFETNVFKTSGNDKIFAIGSLEAEPLTVSLKVDPEESRSLQTQCAGITPGYHLNKKHWIPIRLDGGVPDELVAQLLHDSHALVRPKVPKGRA